jgi:hypothetical protein
MKTAEELLLRYGYPEYVGLMNKPPIILAMEEYANQSRTPLTDEELEKEAADLYPLPSSDVELYTGIVAVQRAAHIAARKMGSSGVDFDFVVWYSGMTIEQVKAAHTRYLNEQPSSPKTDNQ